MRACVSACLLGERCKYNGGDNLVPALAEALSAAGTEVVAVCPEMLGGLPCPRPAAELVRSGVAGDGTDSDANRRWGALVSNRAVGTQGMSALEERVLTGDGDDVTEAFARGARRALALALGDDGDLDLAILQPRSPSCGVHHVYDGTFSGRLIPGSGVFARLLHERGVQVLEPAEWLASQGKRPQEADRDSKPFPCPMLRIDERARSVLSSCAEGVDGDE